MEEIKKIEEKTNTKIKKFNGKKVVAVLLSGAILVGVGYHKLEQKKEIEENKITYEDVMYDEYTEEDLIIMDTVKQIQEYADFVAKNPDDNLYLFNAYYEARNLVFRLHGFRIYDSYGLNGINLKCDGSVVVDEACRGIMFNDLSNRAKLEYISACKEIYMVLGQTYDLFSSNADCHDMDKSLEDFYILPEEYVKTK